MADRMLAERLQPSLLDRLTDEAPDRATDTAAHRMIDVTRLRQILQRDLAWLLNCANLEAEHDLEAYPQVARSVLNYGLPAASGRNETRRRAETLRQAIRSAIERFEPRILPHSLEIVVRQERARSGAIVSFDIRGDLWAEPLPVDLYLRTALDMSTGDVSVSRQG
ncbi:type VI secretion system baseplate subunit TssE [Salipiger bermudensis]|uniref:type VI secretion system baseplate subunit TssE n=1 Tax=Salipiger bermudensis TaxID=344736 RepID=UPI001C990B23|nr:type VI secretion system baseplate subunit TssE [Salipiger bermudensis]MBY6003064.1 type VI secretion system baseplate subunit TssE [Salipiger bermudensis]